MTDDSSSQARVFQGPFFTVRIPPLWEVEIIENIPAFFDPDGSGVLQIAAFRRPAAILDARDEMERYLNQNGVEPDRSRMTNLVLPSGLECVSVEYVLDNRFWMVSAISRNNRLLFVIYNGDEIPQQGTAMLISEVVSSIEFLD